jgi:hypothetical protein
MPRALCTLFVLAASAAFFASPAAAIDVDWFGGITLSDGDRTYLNISAAHFGSDRHETVTTARRLHDPERDLPVLLFLAAESGKSLRFVLDLRLGGLSWWEVRARLGIPPERVIVVLPRDPGPPYGKAHGYYKKHPKGQQTEVVLTDAEFADWVGVRVLSKSYGVDPMVVLEARRSGLEIADVALREEKRKKQKNRNSSSGDENKSSRGKGKDKSKGKGAH